MLWWLFGKNEATELWENANKQNGFWDVLNRNFYDLLTYAGNNALTPVNTYLQSGADSTVFLDEHGDIVKIYHANLSRADIVKYYEIQKTVWQNTDLLPKSYSQHGRDDADYAIQGHQIQIVCPKPQDIEEININGVTHIKVTLLHVKGELISPSDEEYKAIRKLYSEVFKKCYPDVGDNPFFKNLKSHKELPLIRKPNIQKVWNTYYITDVDYIARLLKYF